MKISCDEATSICDKGQYGEISLLEKIKLSWHLFKCKNCGKYTNQNSIMSKCYHKQAEIIKKNKDRKSVV